LNVEYLEISDRFCGPPNSGNGGYVCGLLARNLSGTVSVRLKAPPPLNTGLRLEWTTDAARLYHGATLVGEARRAELSLEPPACPSLGQAERAAMDYPGFKSHVFPRCFVCGPARSAGDGLRIFPGLLAGRTVHAAPWAPHASLADAHGQVAPEFVWSALDCPSGFAVLPVPEGSAIVLGELCACVHGKLEANQSCVVTSWPISHEGRRRTAGAAIHTPQGTLVALARAVWIEVPASQWQ
jgi:hypothetical protein